MRPCFRTPTRLHKVVHLCIKYILESRALDGALSLGGGGDYVVSMVCLVERHPVGLGNDCLVCLIEPPWGICAMPVA
jgi:hypothetical protein